MMTRETDDAIHDSGSTIAQKKKSDMNNRLKMINQYPSAPLISLHLNSFPQDRSVTGAQVFYSKNQEGFGKLAQSTLIKVLKPAKERICKQIPNSIFLMRNSKNPSILVECGFLSNSEEANLLNSADYQRKIAFSLCLCMIEYNHGQSITEES
ncbi:Germination-specific N-acetylmuramoyl-L-alanine amidase [bioreactor metagenome]|uniref:Germination-specific N-acetylmuramoyl-L-alanine amidase n=1 Tax=bioreactor metagenome TaxID=1076179 RepID=A0A645EQI9_9ZZZZ